MAEIYDDPRRAAEESRWGKAIGLNRIKIELRDDKNVTASVMFSKSKGYYLVYAGLTTERIQHIDARPYVDKVKQWRPV